MHVVVVVVPVQRYQHLVLQLSGQDLLLITHLEGNGAVKHQRESSSRGHGLVQQWGFQSSLINHHHNVLQRCGCGISSAWTLLFWLKSQVQQL